MEWYRDFDKELVKFLYLFLSAILIFLKGCGKMKKSSKIKKWEADKK